MSVEGEVSNWSLRIVKRQTTVRMPDRQIVQAERRSMLRQKEGMRGVIKESRSRSQCVCAGLTPEGLGESLRGGTLSQRRGSSSLPLAVVRESNHFPALRM